MQIQFLLYTIIFVSLSKQLLLTQQTNTYLFKTNIGNLNMNLNPILSLQRKPTWIKAQECKYCQLVSSQDTINQKDNSKDIEKIEDKMYDCTQSCFDNKAEDQYGLKCVETHNKCKVIKDNVQLVISSTKKGIGKLIEVKIQAKANDEKFDHFQTILVERIIQVKSTQPSKGEKSKTQPSVSHIGQYMIWGSNPLFETNIITKNNKQQLVIYDSLTSTNLQKQLLPNVNPIDVQFQETVTEFTLSQIKLSQKIILNHPQKIIDDHQIPILPLNKGFFTLQTQNLLLPKKHFLKLIDHLITTYFSTQNNHCQFNDSKISCQKSLTLDKVDFLQLQLILNGISIGFPFKSLIKNCKAKSCDLRVSLSQDQSTFSLGTFFFEIFAVQFIEQTENLKFYRLNNQWNQFYSKDQKYHKENFNIFWWIGSSFFYAIYYVLRIIFYLALFSLIINFAYHWRKIIQWGVKICERIRRRKELEESSQLFEHEEDLQAKDTAKLIKRFKNKRKVFVEDQNETLNDEITTQESN